jgi:uncharacterized protein (DUF433 family)
VDATPPVGEWPTYTYPQVDKLLDLSNGTAKRWINGYTSNRKPYLPIVRLEPVVTSWVTWNEFLEARLMANYRDIDKVPVQHIRHVVAVLRDRTGDMHPLAKWSTYLQPHGRQLLFEAQGPPDEDESFRFVERLTDSQLALTPWVRDFVDSVVLDEVLDDGSIGGIRPDPAFQDIVCIAQRRGGRPTVLGRNVLARTIAGLVDEGEAPEDVAEWYSITPNQVEQATGYVHAHPTAA